MSLELISFNIVMPLFIAIYIFGIVSMFCWMLKEKRFIKKVGYFLVVIALLAEEAVMIFIFLLFNGWILGAG